MLISCIINAKQLFIDTRGMASGKGQERRGGTGDLGEVTSRKLTHCLCAAGHSQCD